MLFEQLNNGLAALRAQSVLRLGETIADFKISLEVPDLLFAD